MSTSNQLDLEVLIKKNIDGYTVDRQLGKPGGYGAVYLAHQSNQPTIKRAIKVYLKELSFTRDTMRSLTHELEFWRTLQEEKGTKKKISLDNIVSIHENGIVNETGTFFDGSLYLVMEYMNGGTLGELQYPDQISLKGELRILTEAAKGLKTIHDSGLLHHDVHPRNILLHHAADDADFMELEADTKNTPLDFDAAIVKLGDFGQSALIKSSDSSPATRKPRYIPPEMSNKKNPSYTAASDIWLFGATMLEIFAGIIEPYNGYQGELANMDQTLVSDNLKAFIQNCLQPAPGKRPDINAVISELDSIRDGIIEREERYSSLIRESAAALNQIGKRANSHKGKALVASDVADLFNKLRASYSTMNKEGFDTPVQELELIINQLLQRDSAKWTVFAKQYDNPEIKVVSPSVAETAKTYRQAIVTWQEQTDKKLLILTPDYTFKVE